jgi:hypothetical protein
MGYLIHRYFAEFHDMQDAAVDALLDLCEDDEEKVRRWDGGVELMV